MSRHVRASQPPERGVKEVPWSVRIFGSIWCTPYICTWMVAYVGIAEMNLMIRVYA